MKSQHVDNRKLFEVVRENAELTETEIEHIGSCEECLELIRKLVSHVVGKRALTVRSASGNQRQ
jgi:hypothetical protein